LPRSRYWEKRLSNISPTTQSSPCAVIDRPASKTRYYVGLAIILLSWLPAYIYAYAPAAMPGGNARIYILAAMDLAFVASVFLMGGEFWEKVRRIFIYEGKV
jgi:hypothetical protein